MAAEGAVGVRWGVLAPNRQYATWRRAVPPPRRLQKYLGRLTQEDVQLQAHGNRQPTA